MYLHHADYNPARIAKADEDFSKTVDFKDTKFPVKTRDIHKIEKERILSALVFLFIKIRKNIQSMFQKML